jgi:hypothetical protein
MPPARSRILSTANRVALLQRDLDRTAECLGRVRAAYDSLLDPFVRRWPTFSEHVLDTPFRIPSAPILMGRIGLCALRSTTALARKFGTAEARALLAGNAAHSGAMLERVPAAATLLLFAAGNVFSPVLRVLVRRVPPSGRPDDDRAGGAGLEPLRSGLVVGRLVGDTESGARSLQEDPVLGPKSRLAR